MCCNLKKTLREDDIVTIYSFDELHSYGYRVYDIEGYNNVLNEFVSGRPVRLVVHYGCIVNYENFVNIANVTKD